MMKRIISMFLVLVLVVICLLPTLAPQAHAEENTDATEPEAVVVDTGSTGGTGFVFGGSSSSDEANAFWQEFDLYSAFNSSSGKYFLIGKFNSSSSPYPVCLSLVDNGEIYFCELYSISPYSAIDFPFGSLVDGLSSKSSSRLSGLFPNYSLAKAAWDLPNATSKVSKYYLTENSFLSFSNAGVTLNRAGIIDTYGFVSEISLTITTRQVLPAYSTDESLLVPDSTPTIPTVTPGGDALDYGTNYYEQNSLGPTLSVTAESPNGGVLSYVWQKYDMNTKVSEIISGATSNSYTVPTDTVGSYIYSCSVTNTYPTGSSVNGTQWAITVYSETQGAGEGITWQILDDGTLLISGRGMMKDYASGAAPWYAYRDSITSIVVNDGISRIGNSAFYNLPNVTSVSLPDSLFSIGNLAFMSCTSLSSIIVPDGVNFADYYAFSNSGIVVAVLPASLRTLNYFAFYRCTMLNTLYSYSVVPPSNSSSTSIWGTNNNLSVIYVPYGSGDAYRNHEDWAEVADKIVEMEPEADPIDTIEELSAVVNQILAEMEEMNTTHTGLLGSILDAINSWGQAIVDAIGQSMGKALEDAFVPSDDAIQDMANNSGELLADRFGAVYEGSQMIDQWAGQLTVQAAKPTVTVPGLTVYFSGVPFSFGGWEVPVVPAGFEWLAESCALVIDIIATLAFLMGMRKRLERTLEG